MVSPAPLERPSTGYLSVFCPCLRAINLFARHPLSTLGHYFSDTLCRRLSDVSLYRWYWPWRPHATTRAYRRPTRRHPRRRCLLLPPPHLSRIWYPLRLCNCPPLYQRTTRSSVFCFTRVEHRNVFYFSLVDDTVFSAPSNNQRCCACSCSTPLPSCTPVSLPPRLPARPT